MTKFQKLIEQILDMEWHMFQRVKGMEPAICQNEFNLLNDITLIIDATGSMASTNKWEYTQEIFQTLFLAIEKFNKNAILFAYNEVRDRCLLTELYKKGKFYTIQPHGKTASGEIIKTLIRKVKGKNKKPIFIHITDGASNWGCPVQDSYHSL